jgi:hypothetical protein
MKRLLRQILQPKIYGTFKVGFGLDANRKFLLEILFPLADSARYVIKKSVYSLRSK